MLSPDRIDLERHGRIKKALKARGTSFSEIARSLGLKHPTVVIVCQGHRTSARVDAAIANALDLTAEELFPERYGDQAAETLAA